MERPKDMDWETYRRGYRLWYGEDPPTANPEAGQAGNPYLTVARDWSRKGLPYVVALLAIAPETKRPIGLRWNVRTYEETCQQLEQNPQALLGIRTGKDSGLVFVDIDGAKGKASLAALEKKYGELPPPMFSTPSGGARYAFKWLPGCYVKTSGSQVAPGIDVRGHLPDGYSTGQSLVPPSARPDGKRYTFAEGRTDLLGAPDMPPWLIFLCLFNIKERERLAKVGIAEALHFGTAPPDTWRSTYEAKAGAAMLRDARAKKLKTGEPRASAAALSRPLSDSERKKIPGYLVSTFAKLWTEIREAPDQAQDITLNNAGMRHHGLLNGARLFGLDVGKLEADAFRDYVQACVAMVCHDKSNPWTADHASEKWYRTAADQHEAADLGHLLDDSGFGTTEGAPGGSEQPGGAEAPKAEAPEADGLISQRAFEIPPEKLHWIWLARWPLGKCLVVAGDQGLGKSTLLLDAAARVTRGAEWPDGSGRAPMGTVIIFASEDDPADTIIPRLMAADADLNKVHIIRGVREAGKRRTFNLAADLQRLESKIVEVGDAILVIFDPMSSYLGKTDSYRNTEVRAVLEPLGDMAARHRVSIVANAHLSKNGKGSANKRVLDSVAFTAHSRGVNIVAEDPDNPDHRLFLPSKTSLTKGGRKLPGLRFELDDKIVDAAKDIRGSFVKWLNSDVTVTADEALAAADERTKGPSALDDAKTFLRSYLQGGPKDHKDVKGAASAECISPATLKRAKAELNVQSTKKGLSSDDWLWSLGPVKVPTDGFGPFSGNTKH